ncbi:MAG: hypothetical protein FWD04_09340 [Conexibacteraceae bacterium]|nr:hypothetical protein [Conexibacteraceae bacterium]
MSTEEQVKTFKVTPRKTAASARRMEIGSAATATGVRVVSLEEASAGRNWTKIEVTVAGHPSQIRAFHKELFPDGGGSMTEFELFQGGGGLDDVAFGLVMDLVVDPAFKAVRERWRRHRDPPLPGNVEPGPGQARTTVTWRWEQTLADGDAAGPVVICRYAEGEDEPETTEEWPNWIRRSQALAFAKEHNFVFEPHDLPED